MYGLSAGESRRSLGYESNGTEDANVRLLHPHYMLMAGQLDADDTLDRLWRLQQHGLLPPWGLVENVNVDLTEYLPMIGSLNASFEALGAYHLWAAASGNRDEIYVSARACPLTRHAAGGFFSD